MIRCPGPNRPNTIPASRRDFLCHAGGGFGMIALAALLAEQGLLAAADERAGPADRTVDPLAPRPGHHAATAQRVIFLFMSGGPSHLELFDPKPDLQRLHGQPLPESFGRPATRRGVERNRLLATRRTFRKYGQAGIEVSDFLPHTRGAWMTSVCCAAATATASRIRNRST